MASFILSTRRAVGALHPDDYIVKTLVTTPMLERLAEYYGVRTCGNVLTGFKWIGGVVDDEGPERFLFAAEEAHGYLVGDYVRDKDAAGAAMLLAELAAQARHEGKTLHQQLDELYALAGYHAEVTISRTFPGAAGMASMQQAMNRLRTVPPASLGGLQVVRQRDYLNDTAIRPRSRGRIVDGKECDLLFFDLESPGNSVAVRPSGTEPKLKFYLFGFQSLGGAGMSERVRNEVADRLAAVQVDLLQSAGIAP